MATRLLRSAAAPAAAGDAAAALRRVTVVCDDFGKTQGYAEAALAAFDVGRVSVASLMVNGSDAERAARLARRNGLPLGLHLNITEGRPMCASVRRYFGPSSGLTTPDGNEFLGKQAFFALVRDRCDNYRRACMPFAPTRRTTKEERAKEREAARGELHALESAIAAETRAQMDAFFELTRGRPPRHLCGHHHCHVLWPVAPAIADCIGPRTRRVTFENTARSRLLTDTLVRMAPKHTLVTASPAAGTADDEEGGSAAGSNSPAADETRSPAQNGQSREPHGLAQGLTATASLHCAERHYYDALTRCSGAVRSLYRWAGLDVDTGVTAFAPPAEGATVAAMGAALESALATGRPVELMVHGVLPPRPPKPQRSSDGTYVPVPAPVWCKFDRAAERRTETDFLLSPAFGELLERHGFSVAEL